MHVSKLIFIFLDIIIGKKNNMDEYISTDPSLSHLSIRVLEIKLIFLSPACFIFQNGLGIILS